MAAFGTILGACSATHPPAAPPPEASAAPPQVASAVAASVSTPPPAPPPPPEKTASKRHRPRSWSDREWSQVDPVPLLGAEDRGCSMRIKGGWLRLTCPAKTSGGKRLIDVVTGNQCESLGRVRSAPRARRCASRAQRARSTLHSSRARRLGCTFLWEDQERSFNASHPPSAPPVGGFSAPEALAAADRARLVRVADCCVKQTGAYECSGRIQQLERHECAALLGNCPKYVACATGETSPAVPAGSNLLPGFVCQALQSGAPCVRPSREVLQTGGPSRTRLPLDSNDGGLRARPSRARSRRPAHDVHRPARRAVRAVRPAEMLEHLSADSSSG